VSKLTIGLLLCVALLPNAAYADQCAVELDKDAVWFDLVMNADQAEIVVFCERCGETAPRRISVLDLQETERDGEHLLMYPESDGRFVSFDLAYVYIPTVRTVMERDGGYTETIEVFFNLAVLTGCDVSGVTPGLRFVNGVYEGHTSLPQPAPTE